jgi:TonB-linked SusC/RagA family outer membrane protein
MIIGGTGDTTYQRFGTDPLPQQNNSSAVTDRTQQFYSELSTGISRTFGQNTFDALVLANMDQYTSNWLLAEKYKSIAANVQYCFADKYIIQAAASYMGDNRYLPGKQAGFFPSAGLAWNLHKEDFLAHNPFINMLKLRASYGLNGNATPGYYEFITDYIGATGYVFGTAAGAVGGIQEATQGYMRTWEKSLKLNLGFDLGFAKEKGWLSFDYYKNKYQDLLQIRGDNTDLFGAMYPFENLGKNDYSGVEMNLGWADKIGRFAYVISGNLSTIKSKVVYNDEPAKPYGWMQRTGMPVGQFYGYIADGFATTAGQGPVVEGYQSVPGDIKYKDLNGDGVINLYDQTTIGSTKPVMFYGLNASLKFKNLYLDILFQGIANNQMMLTGNTVWEFQSNGKGQAYPHHLERWTPATAATATYPRLSVGTNPNNDVPSTFWLANASFLRLKNAEIGYNFTGGILKKANLKSVRVFVNGLNLLTFSSFDRADPETPFANYPVQKVINGGVSVTL